MLKLPELLNDFNVYDEGEKLIGVDGDVELPELKAITDTLSGSGVLGELEAPATGQFEDATVKVKWTALYKDMFKLSDTTKPQQLTFRGSLQCIDTDTGYTDYYPVKIVVRGKAKTTNLGKLEKGKKMECETEIGIMYIKVQVNKETLLELDKLNFKFILNGEDKLEKIRAQV